MTTDSPEFVRAAVTVLTAATGVVAHDGDEELDALEQLLWPVIDDVIDGDPARARHLVTTLSLLAATLFTREVPDWEAGLERMALALQPSTPDP